MKIHFYFKVAAKNCEIIVIFVISFDNKSLKLIII